MSNDDDEPDVHVVLKDGDGHGTADGTPLCVALTEDEARHRKIGSCVRYVPAARLEKAQVEIEALMVTIRSMRASLARADRDLSNPIFED